MSFFYLIFFVIVLALAGFIMAYSLMKKRVAEMQSIYSSIHREAGFDNVIATVSAELAKKGVTVAGFLKKNRTKGVLENNLATIPILERSSAVLAYFSQRIVRLNPSLKADEALVTKFARNITFVPLSMQHGDPCWTKNDCYDTTCRCYKVAHPRCWVDSGATCRGKQISLSDKTNMCFNCEMLLPIGVFIIEGPGARKAFNFLNTYISPLIRNFVEYDRVAQAASRDPLTGVLNKPAFVDRVNHLMTVGHRTNMEISLAMIDIDYFKTFNDSYGHQVGDLVVKKVADTIQDMLRESDILARYAGDEFIMVLPATNREGAFTIAEKIRKMVEIAQIPVDRNITISIGIATLLTNRDSVETVETFIKKADDALLRAKVHRNKVVIFKEDYATAQVATPPKKPARTARTPKGDSGKKKFASASKDGGNGNGSRQKQQNSYVEDSINIPGEGPIELD